jgi:molybdopterin-guanine dinucleotide biosynthesis protein A
MEICILAGGLSQRMGRDKSRLKLGRRTLLGHIRHTAKSLNRRDLVPRGARPSGPQRPASGRALHNHTLKSFPVRIIRRDLIPRCGPLGGIFTALKTTRAAAVMFLACDMPFITAQLLRTLAKKFRPRDQAIFVHSADGAGFPFILHRETLLTVTAQIENKKFAVHALARRLNAKRFIMPLAIRYQLANINTPDDLANAQAR